MSRAGLTIRGAPYQRKAGALFSYAKPVFSYLWRRCTLFPKSWLFLVVVTFKRTLYVRTSKQRGKYLAADRRGPLATGGPPMVKPTTSTVDNPALMMSVKSWPTGLRWRRIWPAPWCTVSLRCTCSYKWRRLERPRSLDLPLNHNPS